MKTIVIGGGPAGMIAAGMDVAISRTTKISKNLSPKRSETVDSYIRPTTDLRIEI